MKRVAKITVVAGYTGYWWRMTGANLEIICTSEMFKTRSNALRAARRAKALMVEAEIK